MMTAVTSSLSRVFGTRRAVYAGGTAIVLALMSPAGVRAERSSAQLAVSVTVVRSCSMDSQGSGLSVTCSAAGRVGLQTGQAMTIQTIERRRPLLVDAPPAGQPQLVTLNF